MFEKLSPKSIKIVMVAQEEARRFLNSFVLPEHLLLGLLKETGTNAYKLLNERGINYEEVFEKIKNDSNNHPAHIRLEMQFSPITKQAVEMAADEAERLDEELIEPEHLLLGIVNIGESKVTEILRESGINLSRIRWHLLRLRENHESPNAENTSEEISEIYLTADLTSKVEKKEIESVIEKDEFIEEIISYLNLFGKIFPIIIGEIGVGKTSIITGLTQYLMEGKIYKELQNFRVLEFNFKSLFYEATDSNDINKKFKELLENLKDSKDIILVIDGLHIDETSDFFNQSIIYSMLIHFIKNNKINIIAIENKENYNSFIKKSVLNSYFTPIEIYESNLEETLAVLEYKSAFMAKYYEVNIEKPALTQIISFAKKVYPEEFYPGSAIKLMDILLSKKKFSKSIAQAKIKDIEKNLRNIRTKRDQYISEQSFEKLENLRLQAHEYEEQIKKLNLNVSSNIKPTLTVADVQLIVKEKFKPGENI